MIRKITITKNHFDAASFGAGTNVLARAMNDHIRSDYRATVSGADIKIWEKGFLNNSLHSIPLPSRLVNNGRNVYGNADEWIKNHLPYEFEIEFPEEYHRRPERNLEESFEFQMRHGE